MRRSRDPGTLGPEGPDAPAWPPAVLLRFCASGAAIGSMRSDISQSKMSHSAMKIFRLRRSGRSTTRR